MATHKSNRFAWKKAGRTLTVCAADAFAVSGGKEKAFAIMLATFTAQNRRVISSPRQLTARVARA